MKKYSLLAYCIFLFHISWGGDANIEFTEFDLDNGLHVILHEDNSAPIVVVSVLYHVGSKNENPERTGFAHFFEHLLFEGSENIKRGEFDSLITIAGGVNNAGTSFDYTYYYEILPSNQLKLGLYLESERMLHAKIDQVGVDTQREVVKEEKRQNYDNRPYGTMYIETFKKAYTKHPYQWMPIGSLEHLNEATLEEFMEFYKTFYVPQNATLSIAGDLDINKTREWIEYYFKDIPRGSAPVPRPDVVEPEQHGEKRDVVYDNVQLPMVLHAYHIPEQASKDFYTVEMLTKILADGQSSRLYKELVDNQQIALTSGAFTVPTEDPGLFIALALANNGIEAEKVEEAMDEQVKKLQENLVSDREFEKIRNQVENDIISQNATMSGIAENLAMNHVFFGDANKINTKLEHYLAVNKEDILRAAQNYLNPDNRVVLYYLPKGNEEKE
jgi:predicted Zn-dependent peptidase